MKHVKLFEEFAETKSIGLGEFKPNVSPNPVLQGKGEDERLMRIRQFKGGVEDYKNYWDDRINQGTATTDN
jgi:hypothetical protein